MAFTFICIVSTLAALAGAQNVTIPGLGFAQLSGVVHALDTYNSQLATDPGYLAAQSVVSRAIPSSLSEAYDADPWYFAVNYIQNVATATAPPSWYTALPTSVKAVYSSVAAKGQLFINQAAEATLSSTVSTVTFTPITTSTLMPTPSTALAPSATTTIVPNATTTMTIMCGVTNPPTCTNGRVEDVCVVQRFMSSVTQGTAFGSAQSDLSKAMGEQQYTELYKANSTSVIRYFVTGFHTPARTAPTSAWATAVPTSAQVYFKVLGLNIQALACNGPFVGAAPTGAVKLAGVALAAGGAVLAMM